MQEKVLILTDTNSGICAAAAQKLGIGLIPMPFTVNGREYLEDENITQQQFFALMEQGAQVSTSQPSPGQLLHAWDEGLRQHDYIVYIPMSSALSSTCQSAQALAKSYDGRVLVADNKRISVTQLAAVQDAAALLHRGASAFAIARYLNQTAMDADVFVSVNTLEYLKKSGRVTAAGAALGSILNIKPVLRIQGGKLDAYKKVRGMQGAMNAMLDGIENDAHTFFRSRAFTIRAAYSRDEQAGERWRHEIKKRFPGAHVELDALPLSIACHVGPGALGVGICAALPPAVKP